jgi:hypothetical protein
MMIASYNNSGGVSNHGLGQYDSNQYMMNNYTQNQNQDPATANASMDRHTGL